MAAPATPLEFLAPGWFSIVMGLCGLSLAWHRALPMLGDGAGAAALVLGAIAALAAVVLAVASAWRWHRHASAVVEDLHHPVRHVFVAAMPVSMILLSTVAVAVSGPNLWARGLWVVGSVWQLAVTVWVLSRWLAPAGGLPAGSFWMGMAPALLIPVVGNVLVPLAGVSLGYGAWSAAQFGVGLFFWPLVIGLLVVRIGVAGLWPQRLLPTTFITMAPPSVIGLAALQLGAPDTVAWAAWGIALAFALWSASVLRRALDQPFAIAAWALSFPLAAFSALSLRLAAAAALPFQVLALAMLALATLVVAALVLATVKGLRRGTLLVPEPVAPAAAAPAGARATPAV
jgi:tellurite resistance protein